MGERFCLYAERVIKIGLVFLFFTLPLVFYIWNTTFTMTKDCYAELVLLCITSLWAVSTLEKGKVLPVKSSQFLPVIVFALFISASLIWTVNLYDSLRGLARWATYIATYFIITFTIREKRQVNSIIMAALSSGFIASIYLILQFYGIDFPFWAKQEGRQRLFSTFGNPNYLAGYLAATIPISFVFFFFTLTK